MESMAASEVAGIPLHFESGVWLADFYSSFGMMEVMVGGGKEGADPQNVRALENVASELDELITRAHRQLSWRLLLIGRSESR